MFVAFCFIIAIVIGVGVFVQSNVNPMIITISNERIRALTTEAVSAAVLDVMSANADTDYLTVSRDDKNAIKSVVLDSETISRLAQEVTINAQKKINEVGQDGIKIP